MRRAFVPHASRFIASPRSAVSTRRTAAAAFLATLPALLGGCSPSESAARAQHATVAADSIVAATAAETTSVTTTARPITVDSGTGAVSGGPTPQGEPTLPSSISARAEHAPRQPVVALSPLADTIANSLVFAPRTQVWFTAATRNKRLLIDIGRVDTDVKKTPERRAAYKEAVSARSTFARDARFRLHGEWGVEEVTIADYDVWNGRIVGVAQGSPQLDSIAKHAPATVPIVAAAELLPPPSYAAAAASGTDTAGTTMPTPAESSATSTGTTTTSSTTTTTTTTSPAPLPTPLPRSCVRDSASAPLAARAVVVRDSLDALLRQTAMPPYEEVARTVTVQSSQVIGCFLPPAAKMAAAAGGASRGVASAPVTPVRGLVLAVSLRDAGKEFLQERIVHIDDATGAVTPLRVADLRFKAHDLLAAYDADGDGVDDLAAKGVAEASGATVVLRFDQKTKKFLRLSSGFAWESR